MEYHFNTTVAVWTGVMHRQTTPTKSEAPGCVTGGSNFSEQTTVSMVNITFLVSLGVEVDSMAFGQF